MPITFRWLRRLIEVAFVAAAVLVLTVACDKGTLPDSDMSLPVDADGDGYDENSDCDDSDASRNSGATELCGTGVDENCNWQVDEGCLTDADGDGFTDDVDCDDANAQVYPGAVEACEPDGSPNGVDEDCSGSADEDCTWDAGPGPLADAGPDQTVTLGAVVVLSGSGTSFVDGGSLTWFWELQSKPANSGLNNSSFSDRSAATTTFTPDREGTYRVSLSVFDGRVWSAPDLADVHVLGADAGATPDAGTADAGAPDAGLGIITSFTASSASVPEGSNVTLTWTSTADSCSLMPSQFSILPANHSTAVQVDMTTTFTLTCYAGGVSESRTLDVTATPAPPAITSFMAQSLQVSTGMNAELSWTTQRATACTLDPGAMAATVPSGFASLPITATTTYTLTCTGAVAPPATQSVTVTYLANAAPVAVIDTPANGATIEAGTEVNFTATCTDDGAGGATLAHAWFSVGGVLEGTTEDLGTRVVRGSGMQTWSYSCTDALGSQTTVQVSFTVVQPVFVKAVAGNTHACGLTASGRVLCWGNNADGQVGLPGAAQYLKPTVVGAATDWASLAAGRNLTCAINTGGQLWCWGTQAGGIGDGVAMTRATPTRVDGATDWARVTIGVDFACGLKTTGSLWCWGTNTNGQLGQGNTTDVPTPVRVGAASDWLTVEAGMTYVCGVRMGGTAWCWGDNSRGNLGDTTLTQRTSPVQAGPTITWQSITTGSLSTCGISTAGALYCWGWDIQGQLGDGTPGNNSNPTPTRVGMASDWAQVSEGGLFTFARKTNNTLWGWGSDVSGQQGNGAAYSVAVPTQLGTATDWIDIYAADSMGLGLRTGGALWTWGSNSQGQVGVGAVTGDVQVPTLVGP